MNATAQAPSLTVRQEVAASPRELFDAWLDPDELVKWMRPEASIRSDITNDPRVGGELEVLMHTSRGDFPHTGAYQVIDRPKRLAFTWNSESAGSRNSLVTVDFNPAGRGTEVVLKHENLPSQEEADNHRDGWSNVLRQMSQVYSKDA
jgi:uncharacterized protein YndB with AHSA1/START domain